MDQQFPTDTAEGRFDTCVYVTMPLRVYPNARQKQPIDGFYAHTDRFLYEKEIYVEIA